ncbi:PaaI family thioesterase [Bradyrhizobium tropiciagri]|uniref:PaaI family thioesterase n=1 Tax=Bradyrhizobium tropiciagri TaxID=312253 RepID=UPI001BA6AD81|nr:PaaI family thioesterase [Bradyrhizobium tropiciagri]MBR0898598.1 PaaI family thioesterase [Bradyrhizobium tropiciagri]
MSTGQGFDLDRLVATNASAAFNRLAGFEVVSAGAGEVVLRMAWRDDLTQYAGHLHAGMIAALLDTACGFAAASIVGSVTASHFSMNCLKPAVGRSFTAKGALLRAGRRQVFARSELFAENEQGEAVLVATGETVLIPLAG